MTGKVSVINSSSLIIYIAAIILKIIYIYISLMVANQIH